MNKMMLINWDGPWGKWKCPACGNENEDPEDIYQIRCSCNVKILLGPVEDDGHRDAWLEEDNANTADG